jgi:tetrahydromethanopterin S-methyltransferase subunit C
MSAVRAQQYAIENLFSITTVVNVGINLIFFGSTLPDEEPLSVTLYSTLGVSCSCIPGIGVETRL